MTSNQALKRQYLQAGPRAGVYVIANRITGRTLVAGSMNAQGAINRHRFELRCGSHRNAPLARDWADHGEASFRIEVLDMVQPTDDPAFDIARELDVLIELWRAELACAADGDYAETASAAR